MSLRVCFLGNSHIAALREAWDTHPGRWPGIDAQFVGAHKDLLLQTRMQGSRLVPATDAARDAFARLGGVSEVDLDAFDHIVITGCMVALAQSLNTYRDARWIGLPSLAACPDLGAMPETLISRRAALATIAASIGRRLGPQLAAHLRQGTDRPVWITSQPRASAAIRRQHSAVTRAHRIVLRNGDGAALSATHEDAAARACAAAGARYVAQPAHTIDGAILTALPFVQGAKRLAARPDLPQPKTDVMHANASYGAAVIDRLAELMAG